ncbi:MAG TPA: copper homeostasis membrane protein CopD [Parvibaculum sp.]
MLTICIWVQFAAAMLLFGGGLFRLLLGEAAAAIDAALVRWLRGAAVVACLSALGWLLLESANMGNGWPDAVNPASVAAVLRETEFGHVWIARLGLVLFLLAVALAPASRCAFRFGTGFAALFLASLALTGHAVMNAGVAVLLHPLNQAVHLLAGGAWIGALLPLWLCLRRGRGGDERLTHLAVRRFARLGYAAVALVLASGFVNVWFLVGSLHALEGTFYGHLLLVKLALVAAMLALAVLNRVRLAPRLAAGDMARLWLKRSVTAEILFAICILAAASFLGASAPAL